MNNRQKIINYIKERGMATPHELVNLLNIGNVMVHRYLKEFVERGILVKQGMAPRVFYALKNDIYIANNKSLGINPKQLELLQENFTTVLANGYEITGLDGFLYWCNERNYDPEKKAIEFEKIIRDYDRFKKNGIIDATQKITSTFSKEQQFLDHLYFLHPYSLPVFGKTKIATWLFHGKQTQSKLLIKRVLDTITPEIKRVIQENNYDAIAFVPPSVPREIQFMKELERAINVSIPLIKIEKIKNPIIIQQKSLKDLNDRIENASSTLVVTTHATFKKVLIIDDFTGSGSTLNVLAEKMKRQQVSPHVDGLTITGSMNGFEVIKEI